MTLIKDDLPDLYKENLPELRPAPLIPQPPLFVARQLGRIERILRLVARTLAGIFVTLGWLLILPVCLYRLAIAIAAYVSLTIVAMLTCEPPPSTAHLDAMATFWTRGF